MTEFPEKGDDRYKVVLLGECLDGYHREDVAASLARLFHSNEQTMSGLLNGKPTALKKRYPLEEAQEISEAIIDAGAGSVIEREQDEPASTDDLFEGNGSAGDDSEGNNVDEIREMVEEDAMASDESMEHNSTLGEGREGEGREEEANSVDTQYFDQVGYFVKHNVLYYLGQFSKFGNPSNPSFAPTWHWPAFFGFFFWALYRKMWKWAGINLVGGLLFTMVFPSNLLLLVWSLAWTLVANYLYYQTVRVHIHYPPNEPRLEHWTRVGGVSKASLIVGLSIAFFVTYLSIQNMAEEFLEEHSEELSDVMPGSGSQTRGDGSVLSELGDDNSPLSETSGSLRVLATSMKLLMVGTEANPGLIGESQSVRAVDLFIEKVVAQDVQDGWGSPLRFEYKGDHYVISSAGPDGVFLTNDDVLQRINIPINYAT